MKSADAIEFLLLRGQILRANDLRSKADLQVEMARLMANLAERRRKEVYSLLGDRPRETPRARNGHHPLYRR